MIRLAAAVVGAAGLAMPAAYADDVAPAVGARVDVLNLRSGDVDLTSLPNLLEGDAFPSTVCVIQLDGPMTTARRAALIRAGAVLRGYLPTNSFLADLDACTPAALRAAGGVRRVVAYVDDWKSAPELRAPQPAWIEPPRQALAQAGVRVVSYWLFAGRTPDALGAAVTGAGGRETSRELVAGTWCVTAHVPEARALELSRRADVHFAEDMPEFTLRSNSTLRGFVQSGSGTSTPFYDRGLHGEDQIVGVIDSRININHCSFSDPEGDPPGPNHRKVLAYNTTLGSVRHGTHVAATLAGDGGGIGDTRGIAYLARLVYNIHPDPDETSMYSRFDLHASQGARVHSNSWGADGVRAYDGACRAIDAFTHGQEDNLIVHAVSNSSVVYNPENAKNSLAVSAAGGFGGGEESMCVGGAGPTEDGRRKPEITSVGCSLASASHSTTCSVIAQTGTSMAAPGVSGAATLLRQYFTDGFYPSGTQVGTDGFVPSGQLLKAMLINGASDMTGVAGFPNTREGWGRVNAGNSAYFAGDARRLALRDVRNTDTRALDTNSQHVWTLDVLPGNSLKITLAWADAPAQANATFAPVNNIDLAVESPSGALYFGNVFASGVSITGGSTDAINNLEQVLVLAPEAGVWTVRVLGAAVNDGSQGYALVATGGVTDTSCAADFNYSGGVDGDDVIAFFAAWDAGTAEADLDRTGGIDGDDVILFFTAWDAGC